MATLPPTVFETLPDGSVVIRVGHLAGTVSSGHLIEPKVHQLQAAWLKEHQEDAEG